MTDGTFDNSDAKLFNAVNCNNLKLKKPVLVFNSVHAEPQFPKEHEPFTVYFNFKNIRNVDEEEFTIRMIIENKEDSSLGTDQEDQRVSSLKQGATGEVDLAFNYGMPAGIYVIDAYFDYYNQIFEQDEDLIHRHTSYEIIVG